MEVASVKQRLFTVDETSKITRRSRSSIWRDIKAGRLDVVHIGNSTRVTGESIDRLCTPSSAPLRENAQLQELAPRKTGKPRASRALVSV